MVRWPSRGFTVGGRAAVARALVRTHTRTHTRTYTHTHTHARVRHTVVSATALNRRSAERRGGVAKRRKKKNEKHTTVSGGRSGGGGGGGQSRWWGTDGDDDDTTRGPVVVRVLRNISVVPRSVTRFVAFLVHLFFHPSRPSPVPRPFDASSRRQSYPSRASCRFGYRRCRYRHRAFAYVFPKADFRARPFFFDFRFSRRISGFFFFDFTHTIVHPEDFKIW